MTSNVVDEIFDSYYVKATKGKDLKVGDEVINPRSDILQVWATVTSERDSHGMIAFGASGGFRYGKDHIFKKKMWKAG